MPKGQFASEFLMTYGWAILIILACAGAISYFLNISTFQNITDKCTLEFPFVCEDSSAYGNTLTLSGSYQGTEDIDFIEFGFEDNLTCQNILFMNQDSKFIINCSINEPLPKNYKAEFNINFTKRDSQLKHSKKGTIALAIS